LGEEVELRQYAALLWRWAWLIILCTVLAAGSAFWVSSRIEPVYQANATLLVSQATNRSLIQDLSALTTSERLARTYSEMLRKRPILERAIQEMGLAVTPEQLAPLVKVQVVRDTQLINLSVENTDPVLAMALANTIPQVFADFNREMQTERFTDAKKSLSEQMKGLQSQIADVQTLVAGLLTSENAEGQAERIRLQLWLTQLQDSYSSLQRSYEDIRLAEANAMDTITVVEPAEVPKTPVRPKPLTNALLAAAVGAMLGTGIAFLIEYMDDTLKDPDDVERTLGLSTLGTITRFGGKNLSDKLITAEHSRSFVTEAYRILRTNLEFASVDEPLRTIMVTSPNPVEGKTVTATNLAVVMAQSGRSVILLDADLRRPAVHRMFDLPNGVGLTTALVKSGNPAGRSLLQETAVEGLRVLTSGPLPPNPAELLGSEQMVMLIETLKDQADLIVFDSPPALLVADPAVLAREVDAVLVVVDTGTTRRGMALQAVESLAKVGANVVGVVLNRFSPRGSGHYYYHYDYYYSSDGHGDAKRAAERPSSRRWKPQTLRKHRWPRTEAPESEGSGRVIKVKENPDRGARL